MIKSYDGILDRVIRAIFIVTSVIYMYTAGFGLFSDMTQRALLITLLCPTVFIVNGIVSKGKKTAFTRVLDMVLAALFAVSGIYIMTVWGDRILKSGGNSQLDVVFATIIIILLLEITRRTTGLFLTLTCVVFIIYALFGPYFPTALAHRGQTWSYLVEFLYMSTEGVFGTPSGIAATYIIIFVIFGGFLETFGAGEWFVNMAYAITGQYRGGPAKTAVVSSALMGMISGSSTANVATTGTFTIPLMKKTGYQPHEAGAIEAVASTGGMFTPPIMGAAAFIMAEYLDVSYWNVAIAATIPAVLYYVSLMLMVDALAVKGKLKGLPKESLPSLKTVMKERGFFLIPLLFLVIAIIIGWSPMKSAFWATLGVVAVAFLSKLTRPNFSLLLKALESGSKQVVSIAATCATAGIIVGVMSITGLGAKLSYTLISLSNGNVYIAAIITAIITLILGCGMPPASAYIILVTALVPPLVKMGVLPLAAHMFIFVFSCVGVLTPPVAVTAYTGAAIAKADPNKTGWRAFRMGAVAYIIPFMYLLAPSLLLVGEAQEVITSVISATIGVLCFVCAVEGYFIWFWSAVPRIMMGIAALLLLKPGILTDLAGIGIIVLAVLLNKFMKGKQVEKEISVN